MGLKLFLSDHEQLGIFDQSNAAQLLIEFTSLSEEIYYARDMHVFGEVPRVGRLSSEHIIRVAHSILTPEKKEVVEQIFAQMTPKMAHTFSERCSFLCPEAQVKIFDFPKDTIKKILRNYHQCRSWELCEEAQVRFVSVFSPQEIKVLCKELHICLCEKALLEAMNIFSPEDFAVVLAGATNSLPVEMFEKIRTSLSKEEAVNLLLAFIEQGGIMWDEIQRRILERFPQDDAKKIFLKHLDKHGFMADEVKVKMWRKFIHEDALEIFKASSEVEKTVDGEVLMFLINKVPGGEQFLLNYARNGVDFEDDVQNEMMDELSKEMTTEILSECKKHGYKLCRRAQRFLKRNG